MEPCNVSQATNVGDTSVCVCVCVCACVCVCGHVCLCVCVCGVCGYITKQKETEVDQSDHALQVISDSLKFDSNLYRQLW